MSSFEAPDAALHRDAIAWADAFASGRLHPRAALEFLLERIERIDPLVCACNHLAPRAELLDAADAAAERWRGGAPLSVLDGIPFGVKANIAVAGLPWHAGIAAFRDRIATQDAVCVARLRAAGLIPAAVLNMHEAALGQTTDNPAFGRTLNPRATDRIPGGSSGGSAAAVAAGMLPLSLGTDDLGSVRLPSALCGIVGFKPAHGEISLEGVVPLSPRLDHVGIQARSVRDVVGAFGILRGRNGAKSAESGASPRAVRPLSRWILSCPDGVDPEVAEAFQAALQNAPTERTRAATLDWSHVDLSALRRAGLLLCEIDAAEHFAVDLRARREGFSQVFRRMVSWGAAQAPAKVRAAEKRLARVGGELRNALKSRLLSCPTTPRLPPRRDTPVPVTLADFTVPAAVAGVPAISVPLGSPKSGLPVGLQLVGIDSDEVLEAAARFCPTEAVMAQPSELAEGGSLSRAARTPGAKRTHGT